MFESDGYIINNDQYLIKNKINEINKNPRNNINTKSKVLFRNKTINSILNKKNKFSLDYKKNRMLSEDILNFINIKDENRNINSFNKFLLKLPSLSEKLKNVKDLKNSKKKNIINKKFEIMYNSINKDELKRKNYIEKIMKSCCSVVKMKLPKNRINKNYESFEFNLLKNKNNGYKPIILYKNTSVNNTLSNCNSFRTYLSYDSYRKDVKQLINAETMTNNRKNNFQDKNSENLYDSDFLISSKIFNKYNQQNRIKGLFQLKNYNKLNSKFYREINV